jgi:hypothetical protein
VRETQPPPRWDQDVWCGPGPRRGVRTRSEYWASQSNSDPRTQPTVRGMTTGHCSLSGTVPSGGPRRLLIAFIRSISCPFARRKGPLRKRPHPEGCVWARSATSASPRSGIGRRPGQHHSTTEHGKPCAACAVPESKPPPQTARVHWLSTMGDDVTRERKGCGSRSNG